MRSDQINSLRRGDSQILFEMVNQYKDDVLSLISTMYVNKDNKISEQEYLDYCARAFIGVLKHLKNAPSGPAFRSWLLKTVYKNEIDKATKNEKENKPKTWKTFTVIKNDINLDKLQSKLSVVPVEHRLAIWASCQERMSIDDAAKLFDMSSEEYTETLIQAMQSVRSRFPSQCKKVPDNLKYTQLISKVYGNMTQAEKYEYENELKSQKIKSKFNDSIVFERKAFSSKNRVHISSSELQARIRAKKRLSGKRITPFIWVTAEILIFIAIVFIVYIISNTVAPADITVKVNAGTAFIEPVVSSDENIGKVTLKSTQNFSKDVTLNKLNVSDTFETDAYSSATCVIDDVNSLQLGANTKIEVLKPSTSYPLSFRFFEGLLWLDIVNSSNKTKIVTETSEYYTNGGQFIFEVTPEFDKVLVFEGSIERKTSKNSDTETDFNKNMAFIVTADENVLKLKKFNGKKHIPDNEFYFNIEDAHHYYFDDNGQFKVLYHWLEATQYPFAETQTPGSIIDKLHKFYDAFVAYNDVLVRLQQTKKDSRVNVENRYTRIKQLEKQLNHKIRESNLILYNQAELNELYEQLVMVKNTSATLIDGSYTQVELPNFSFLNKGVYSVESAKWQAEIKKMREYKLELSTLETLKQLSMTDLEGIKKEKSAVESEIMSLSTSLNKVLNQLKDIEDAKLNKVNSEKEIVKLTQDLGTLKTVSDEITEMLKTLSEQQQELDNTISVVEGINKQLEELRKSLNEKTSDAEKLNAELTNLKNEYDAEQKKIETSTASLKKLQVDKGEYDKQLEEINTKIDETTTLFNASIEKRSETTMKLNELKKQETLLNIKIGKIESEIAEVEKNVQKQTKLQGTQKTVIENLKTQIKSIDDEIENLQAESKTKTDTISKNRNDIEEFTSKSKELETKLKELNETLKATEAAIRENESQLNDVQSKIDALDPDYKTKLTDIETYKKQLNEEVQKLDKLAKEYEASLLVLKENENSSEKLSKDLKFNKNLKNIDDEVLGKLVTKLNDYNSDLTLIDKDIEENMNAMISSFLNRKPVLLTVIMSLIKQNIKRTEVVKNVQETQKLIDATKQKISDLEEKINALKKDIASLASETEKLKETHAEYEKQIASLKLVIAGLDSQLTTLQKEIEGSETAMKELLKKKDETTQLLAKNMKEKMAAKASISEITKATTELKDQEQNMTSEIDQLNKEVESNNDQIEIKQNQKTGIEKKLEKFKEVSITTNEKLASLNNQLEELNKDKEKESAEITKITDSKTALETELTTQKETIFKHQTELNKLKNEKAEIVKKATPINSKCTALEKIISESKANSGDLNTKIAESNEKLSVLKANISELNQSITAQEDSLKKHKPLTELQSLKETKTSEIAEQTNKQNENNRKITKAEEDIEHHKNTIANADELLMTEETKSKNKQETEQKIKLKKADLGAITDKLNTVTAKLEEIQGKIDALSVKTRKLEEYEKNQEFWDQMYDEIIRTETAIQINSYKYEELERQIALLEQKVGDKVYNAKINEIRATQCKLDKMVEEYKNEDRNYWFVTQLVSTAEGDSPDSITSNIKHLVEQTAKEFLPLLFNYKNFNVSDEEKMKILTAALVLYPEYHKLSEAAMHSDSIEQIHKTWRIQLMKILEQNNQLELVDTLDAESLIIPEK